MQKIRAAAVPLLLLAGLCALAKLSFDVPAIKMFSFIWDALLGAVLGVGLCLLPQLSGMGGKAQAAANMYWVCAFVGFALLLYQYFAMSADVHITWLALLEAPSGRMRMMEGAVMGFCASVAMRGRAG